MKYLNYANRLQRNLIEVVIILMDVSISMLSKDYLPSRHEGGIRACCELFEKKSELYPQDRIGIIAFDGGATILQSPVEVGSNTSALCMSMWKKTRKRNGTNFTAAISSAEKVLFGKTAGSQPKTLTGFLSNLFVETYPSANPSEYVKVDSNITRRIIMLTDGKHNGWGSPLPIAERLKSAGAIIECIGIAGRPDDVDEQLLRKIASNDEYSQPRYCFISDTNTLIKKYQSMAHHIKAM